MTNAPSPRRRAAALLLALATFAGGACSSDDGSTAATTTTAATSTTAPTGTSPTTGPDGDPASGEATPSPDWAVTSPEAEGFDADALEKVRDWAFADERNTQGVVIVRHGRIAQEWYADGAGPDSWAASWSVGKSFASALVGIAIDEGLIPSVDEPMTTWYPEWEERGLGDITLEHVLQMADGLRWDETYDAAQGASDIIKLVTSAEDQLEVVRALPREHEPGTVFNYSSGTAMLLSGVIEQATGRPAGEYAQEKLFGPLGFTKADWWRDTEDHTLTYCCVDTTTRDFARLGLLYLREGRWGDEQVVPADWVKASVTGAPTSPDTYGYMWWLPGEDSSLPDDLFSANGHDGQFIFVVPSLDLVVVRNGTYVKDPGEPVADPNLFNRYPPDGLVPGHGTAPPDGWDNETFLGGIIDAITDDEPAS